MWLYILPCLTILAFIKIECASVVSVDLGTRYFRSALIQPGRPISIVTDPYGRKTSVAVAILENKRLVGQEAMSKFSRYPADTFLFLTEMLRARTTDAVIPHLKRLNPGMNIVKCSNASMTDNEVCVMDSRDKEHHIEKLLAMVLKATLRTAAEITDSNSLEYVVLSVPSFMDQFQRRMLLSIPEIIGYKVDGIVNHNLAAAYQLAAFHVDEYKKKPMNVIILDIGAMNTQLSIFKMSHRKLAGTKEPQPHLTMISYKYDRTLGSMSFQSLLREMMMKQFEDAKKLKITDNPRALAKLFTASQQLLERMGSRQQLEILVDNLMGENYKFRLSREEFEKRSQPLLHAAANLVQSALIEANMTVSNISYAISIGGGSRISSLESSLAKLLNRPNGVLDKRVNTDEGVALGSCYFGAHTSKLFHGRSIIVRDTINFDVKAQYKGAGDDVIEKDLFNKGEYYPSKKTMTFPKQQQDFVVKLFVTQDGNTELVGETNIEGFDEALSNQPTAVEKKGVKVHFGINRNQLVYVDKAELILKTNESSNPPSFFGKISNMFKFGGGLSVNDSLAQSTNETSDKLTQKDTNITNDTSMNRSATVVNDITVVEKPVSKRLEVPLKVSLVLAGDQNTFSSRLADAKAVLMEYEGQEHAHYKRMTALNDLETVINEWRSFLSNAESLYYQAARPMERTDLENILDVADEWLSSKSTSASLEAIEQQLQTVQTGTLVIEQRIREAARRDKSLDGIKSTLNSTYYFLKLSTVNLTEHDDIGLKYKPLSTKDVQGLQQLYDRTMAWLVEKEAEQGKLKLSDDAALVAQDIDRQARKLKVEVSMLLEKIRSFRPPLPFAPPMAQNQSISLNNETDNSTSFTIESDNKVLNKSTISDDEENGSDKQPVTESPSPLEMPNLDHMEL